MSQTYQDFEFLIVDDGSTDSTRDLILSFDDARIRMLDNPRQLGLARSLNQGLRLATADLIARQDADDISEPQRLERQLDFLRENPEVALLGSSCTEIDAEGNVLRHVRLPSDSLAIRWYLLFLCPFYHTAVMLRRTPIVKQVGFYNESLSYSMDYEFCRRIACRLAVANLDELLVRYRVHPESMTATFGDRTQEGCQLRLATVSDLLGWRKSEQDRNTRRFNQMYGLLLDELDELTPVEAVDAAEQIMRLHDVCRRGEILGEGDWETHGQGLRSLLHFRLQKVAATQAAR